MASCSGTSREYNLILDVNQVSQNIAGNYSTVSWSLRFTCGQYYYQNGSTTDNFKVYIDGQLIYNQNRAISFPDKNSSLTIASGQTNISHNTDGTKIISFSCHFAPGRSASYYPGVINGSSSLSLSTIPRASVIGTVTYSNFWSAFKVAYTKYYSGFICKLRVSIPAVTQLETFSNYGSNTNVNFSSTVQSTIMQRLISSGSIQLGFVIETWNGSTKIGESSETKITISKPSITQITSVSNFNVDEGFTITLSKSYLSYTSKLEVLLSGTTVYSNTIGNSQKITFSSTQLQTIYNLMKTVNSATFTLRVTSLYGSTNCGSVSINKTGTITNATPTLPGFTWETINHLDLHDNQTIIKGQSNIKVSIQQASAYKGASIAYYQVGIGNISTKVETLQAILKNCDHNAITVYAVDSRGNAVSKQMVCNKYIEYKPIVLETLEYKRSSGGIGSGVTMQFSGSIHTGSFGIQDNEINARYYYKEVNASDYIEGTTDITPILQLKYSKDVVIRGDLEANGFSIDKNFNLRIVVNDRLSSYAKEIILAKGTPALAIHEDGVAVGTFYDENIGGSLQTNEIAVGGNKVSGTLGYKYSLGANVNLNNLTTEGYYNQNLSASASTSFNYPVAEAGLLTVINRGYIYQTYQTYSTSGFFYRSNYNGTWYSWKKVISGDKDITANLTTKGGYLGFDSATGNYLRTPPSGLLPNTSGSGGSGYIGTSGWRFLEGYFKNLNASGTLTVSNANFSGNVINSNWYRTTGNCGWYSNTYGGGIYMTDSTYVRVYNNKHLLCNQNMYAKEFISANNSTAKALWTYRISYGNIDGIQWGNATRTYIHVWTDNGVFGVNVWASDKRLKKHIRDTEVHNALNKIDQIKHVEFDWKESNETCALGYVADDLEKVLPCLVHAVEQKEDEETGIKPEPLKHINHTTLLPLVTMGIQELIQENKYLWEFNNAMVDEVITLKKEIEELKLLIKESK